MYNVHATVTDLLSTINSGIIPREILFNYIRTINDKLEIVQFYLLSSFLCRTHPLSQIYVKTLIYLYNKTINQLETPFYIKGERVSFKLKVEDEKGIVRIQEEGIVRRLEQGRVR